MVVLRCSPRKSDDTAEDDCDSAAESDVLGNKLTVDDDDEDEKRNDKKNAKSKGDSKNAKGDNDQTKSNKKKGEGDKKAKDDNDDDAASVINLDGAADYYGAWPRNGWPSGPSAAYHGAYPTQRPHREERRVHFDMGSDPSRPPHSRYTDHSHGPYTHSTALPGLSQYPGHSSYSNYPYNRGPHPYPNPSHGASAPYYSGHDHFQQFPQNWIPPSQHQPPFAPQPEQNVPGAWPQTTAGATAQAPQPSLNWVQPKSAGKDGQQSDNNDQKTTNPTAQSTTIDPYNGYYWDGNQWRLGLIGMSKETFTASGGRTQATNNSNSNDPWGTNVDTSNSNNNDSNDPWGLLGSNDKQDNKSESPKNDSNDTGNDGWSDKDDDNKNDTGNNWTDTDNNGTTSNGNGWEPEPNTTSGSGGNGWDSSNTNTNSPSTNAAPAKVTLHGPHGAYHGPKIAVQPSSTDLWVTDEPPRYDVPASIVNQNQLSKQIQRGRAYNYYKRHRKPIYVDSIEEPYARFVFKYRTKDKLPKGLNLEPGFEPTPDQAQQDLQDKKREELIEELMRFRMAYGEAAPDSLPKLPGKNAGDDDAQAWDATPPKKSYLQYKLPTHYGDTNGGGKQNGGNNNSGGDTWKTTTTTDSKPAENSWDTPGGGDNAWATTDSGGGGGGGAKERKVTW